MNNPKDPRSSLIDKVNSPNNTSSNNNDFQQDSSRTKENTKKKKSYKNFFSNFKDNERIQKIWKTFFSSKHIDSKPLRYFDRFMKVSFNLGVVFFAVFFIAIITSPNQFTKELIYRKNDTLVYDNQKKLVGKISQNRENGENVLNVTYDQLNQSLINALVGTEDTNFFKHNGIDVLNTVENGVKSKILRSGTGGGSSITQQIIGGTHVDRLGNASIPRKMREIFLSVIAETQLSKKQIMEAYMNYFEFGQGNIRGVELASKYFFNSSASDIDFVQSAILMGTLNAQTAYNPLGGVINGSYVNNSQKRLETVLYSNKNQGYLGESEYYLLQQVKVKNQVDFNKTTQDNKYQDYIDVVAKELKEKYKVDPFVQSLKVYTNMDRKAQYHANKLTNKKEVYVPDKNLNFGFIVSKTQTGEIIALSGGKQYRKGGAYLFNNATDNKQQPGSAFKPIIDYSPTFEFLHWSDRTPISNAPYKYPNTGQVVNNVDQTSGGILTMDRAIASSRNLTALRAMEAVYNKIGFPKLTEYLNGFGFDFNSNEVVPAYGLGALEFGVTPKQMNAAYQAFGNGGYYIEPFTINSFSNEDGSLVKNTTEKKRIIDEKTAFMTSTALERSTNVPGAYISTANYNKTPYAAKTGTSNWDESGAKYNIPNLAPKDTWFTGYTSEYTMSSWGGYDAKEIAKGKYPGWNNGEHDYSAKLWGSMMSEIANGKEKSYLKMTPPDGIVERSFNPYVEPPFKQGSANGFFYSDNVPSGYSNIGKPKEKNDEDFSISLSAGNGSVNAKFAKVSSEYTPTLTVGGNTVSGSIRLSVAANDYDIISAYYSRNGKQYASRSGCYYNGRVYGKCPAKKVEPEPKEPEPTKPVVPEDPNKEKKPVNQPVGIISSIFRYTFKNLR